MMPKASPEKVIKKQIKLEYETTSATSKDLERQYKVKSSTIRSWINREKWVKPKEFKQFKECKKKSVVATQSKGNKNSVAEVEKVALKKEKTVETDDSGCNTELTEKERLFCLYYNLNPNATQAYLKAFNCNYHTANTEGWKLLVKPGIKEELDRLREIKIQSILLSSEDLVRKHMNIAFSSLDQFVEFGRKEVPVMGPFGPVKIKVEKPDGKEVEETLMKEVNDVRFRDWAEVDGSVIKSIKVGKDGASIELYDAQKSMDWLERWFKWNPMDQHKREYDAKRLALSERELDIREAAEKAKNW
jgi:phage terminase small subunit